MKSVLILALAILRSRLIVIILGLASLVCITTAEPLPPPKRVVVPKLQGTTKVDGDLSEPVWAKAAVLQPFYNNDGSGREREHTEVRIWYDDQALYLGWKCRDVDIQATLTNRDSHFWDEEVVEFFITPKPLNRDALSKNPPAEGSGPTNTILARVPVGRVPPRGVGLGFERTTRYFELQWNPLNGVFDAIVFNDLDKKGVSKGFRDDSSFTAKGMANAVKVKGTINDFNDKDEFWQVEVRLPFADLGQPAPKAKAVWRANFYRYNRTKGLPEELLSWSPTLSPGFHEPGRFGYLEFGE